MAFATARTEGICQAKLEWSSSFLLLQQSYQLKPCGLNTCKALLRWCVRYLYHATFCGLLSFLGSLARLQDKGAISWISHRKCRATYGAVFGHNAVRWRWYVNSASLVSSFDSRVAHELLIPRYLMMFVWTIAPAGQAAGTFCNVELNTTVSLTVLVGCGAFELSGVGTAWCQSGSTDGQEW